MSSVMKSQDPIERAMQPAHRAIDGAAELAQPAVDRLTSGAHTAVDKAAAAVGAAAKQLNITAAKLQTMQEKSLEGAREYVRKNPLTAVGLALAAGYLISRVTR
jgi:ElaB/YqjD/DUF883 family membrane-anchored ribosome-binding protein